MNPRQGTCCWEFPKCPTMGHWTERNKREMSPKYRPVERARAGVQQRDKEAERGKRTRRTTIGTLGVHLDGPRAQLEQKRT